MGSKGRSRSMPVVLAGVALAVVGNGWDCGSASSDNGADGGASEPVALSVTIDPTFPSSAAESASAEVVYIVRAKPSDGSSCTSTLFGKENDATDIVTATPYSPTAQTFNAPSGQANLRVSMYIYSSTTAGVFCSTSNECTAATPNCESIGLGLQACIGSGAAPTPILGGCADVAVPTSGALAIAVTLTAPS